MRLLDMRHTNSLRTPRIQTEVPCSAVHKQAIGSDRLGELIHNMSAAITMAVGSLFAPKVGK